MTTPLDIVSLYHPIGNLCIIELTGRPFSDLSTIEKIEEHLPFHPAERFNGIWELIPIGSLEDYNYYFVGDSSSLIPEREKFPFPFSSEVTWLSVNDVTRVYCIYKRRPDNNS